jgi:small subunit ribosomal protein S1
LHYGNYLLTRPYLIKLELVTAMEESKDLFEQPAEEGTKNEEATSNPESMESLLEKEGLGLDFPKSGETRTGVIASISESEVLVSVGAKSEGVISGREFDQIDSEVRSEFEVGKEIPVYVLSLEDKNGNLVLSYNRAREEMDWDFAEGLQESDDIYESNVIGFNKGGLIVGMGQLRGFVPASQIGLSRRMTITGDNPEKRYSKIVGEPVSVRVIEVDRTRRRLILSERMALKETRETLKERLLDDLQVGDVRTGRVTSLADFGAFVNIDGADGLVHLSEIAWERIQSPKEVLKVGQEVQVQVISIDRERKRIGLSLRRLEDNPWLKKVEHLREGQLIEGTITHLTKFGAFAKLGDEDLEGLIHVSELSANRVEHPKEILSEDETLTLRVIKIDKERQRIGLSLRKVDSAAYADLDWKMLREELDSVADDEFELDDESEEPVDVEEVEAPEAASEAEEVEVEAEAAEAAPEIEEVEVEAEAPEAASEVEKVEVEAEAPEAAPEIEEVEVEAEAPEAASEAEKVEVEAEASEAASEAEEVEVEVEAPEAASEAEEVEVEAEAAEAASEVEDVEVEAEAESEEEVEAEPEEELPEGEPASQDDPEPDEDEDPTEA